MKTFKYIIVALIIAVVLLAGLTSCGSAIQTQNTENDVMAYTLKNKTELMQQKILNKKVKTVVATP